MEKLNLIFKSLPVVLGDFGMSFILGLLMMMMMMAGIVILFCYHHYFHELNIIRT